MMLTLNSRNYFPAFQCNYHPGWTGFPGCSHFRANRVKFILKSKIKLFMYTLLWMIKKPDNLKTKTGVIQHFGKNVRVNLNTIRKDDLLNNPTIQKLCNWNYFFLLFRLPGIWKKPLVPLKVILSLDNHHFYRRKKLLLFSEDHPLIK